MIDLIKKLAWATLHRARPDEVKIPHSTRFRLWNKRWNVVGWNVKFLFPEKAEICLTGFRAAGRRLCGRLPYTCTQRITCFTALFISSYTRCYV